MSVNQSTVTYRYKSGDRVIIKRCYSNGLKGHGVIKKPATYSSYEKSENYLVYISHDNITMTLNADRLMKESEYKGKTQVEFDVSEFLVNNKDSLKNSIYNDAKQFLQVDHLFKEKELNKLFKKAYEEFIISLLRDIVLYLKNLNYEETSDVFNVKYIKKLLGRDFFKIK